MNPQIIQLLSGVSSVLGLLSVLAYLYTAIQGRRVERSIRDIVEGDQLFNADQILQILKLFADDAHRLEALARLTNLDRRKAEQLLDKINNNVDVTKLQASSQRHRLASIGTGGAVLLLIGFLGLSWAFQSQKQISASGQPIFLGDRRIVKASVGKPIMVLQNVRIERDGDNNQSAWLSFTTVSLAPGFYSPGSCGANVGLKLFDESTKEWKPLVSTVLVAQIPDCSGHPYTQSGLIRALPMNASRENLQLDISDPSLIPCGEPKPSCAK